MTADDSTVPAEPDVGDACRCPPCPGRGNDGHGMTHCAECCHGTGVEAEPGCPVHHPLPDAGDVEDDNADSYVMSIDPTTGAVTWRAPEPGEAFCPHCNFGITEFLAATADRARREGAVEAGERIAQAIRAEADANVWPKCLAARKQVDQALYQGKFDAMADAARIARSTP